MDSVVVVVSCRQAVGRVFRMDLDADSMACTWCSFRSFAGTMLLDPDSQIVAAADAEVVAYAQIEVVAEEAGAEEAGAEEAGAEEGAYYSAAVRANRICESLKYFLTCYKLCI